MLKDVMNEGHGEISYKESAYNNLEDLRKNCTYFDAYEFLDIDNNRIGLFCLFRDNHSGNVVFYEEQNGSVCAYEVDSKMQDDEIKHIIMEVCGGFGSIGQSKQKVKEEDI